MSYTLPIQLAGGVPAIRRRWRPRVASRAPAAGWPDRREAALPTSRYRSMRDELAALFVELEEGAGGDLVLRNAYTRFVARRIGG